MKSDDLENILAGEEPLVPSSGFADSVMNAVRRDALLPPPIPFPWKRALPGIAALGAALFTIGFLLVQSFRTYVSTPVSTKGFPELRIVIDTASHFGAGWIALALLVSFVSVAIPLLFSRIRS